MKEIFLSVMLLLHPAHSVKMPTVIYCSVCLADNNAEGMQDKATHQVFIRDEFDLTDSHDIDVLRHEFAHEILTAMGIPDALQHSVMREKGIYVPRGEK